MSMFGKRSRQTSSPANNIRKAGILNRTFSRTHCRQFGNVFEAGARYLEALVGLLDTFWLDVVISRKLVQCLQPENIRFKLWR